MKTHSTFSLAKTFPKLLVRIAERIPRTEGIGTKVDAERGATEKIGGQKRTKNGTKSQENVTRTKIRINYYIPRFQKCWKKRNKNTEKWLYFRLRTGSMYQKQVRRRRYGHFKFRKLYKVAPTQKTLLET